MTKRELTPAFQTPVSRRVLPIWNHSHFDAVWVDEPGSCANQHIGQYGLYHRYEDEMGRLVVVRCPERLTWDEKSSVVSDDPEGSWQAKLASRKVDKLEQEARIRRQRMEEEKAAKR